RHSRPDPHRGGEGLDRAAAGLFAKREPRARDPGVRQGAARRPRISAPCRLHRLIADDGDRKSAAARVARAGVAHALNCRPGQADGSAQQPALILGSPEHMRVMLGFPLNPATAPQTTTELQGGGFLMTRWITFTFAIAAVMVVASSTLLR